MKSPQQTSAKPSQPAKQSLTILHLYPREMNLYGDHGNILTLQKRLEWRGFIAKVVTYEPGDNPAVIDQADIIFGGGGQDSGQADIEEDLRRIGPRLKSRVDAGVPTLVVCGLYQLFGNFFQTIDDDHIDGISAFNLETRGGDTRMIGNVTAVSDRFGELVGYENHSGRTTLCGDLQPLARVIRGAGNNGTDGYEGATYQNAIGTYLHGPILPKNPSLADFLLATALTRKYGAPIELAPLDDSLADLARTAAKSSPR
jgi:CobQ-like glutamine amidotransferase family enzyme